MKNPVLKCMVCSFVLLSNSCLAELRGTSFFSPRSQCTNTARELVGWHRFINKPAPQKLYGAFSVTPEYLRSFGARRLAEYFFGTNKLTISGSLVGNAEAEPPISTRTGCDLLADYFGLSPKFSSTVCVTPKMQAFITDFGLYLGRDAWYFRAHTPLVWTEYALCLKETIKNKGTDTPFPANYMTAEELEAPFTSWCQAMQGCKDWGDTKGLQAGRICGPQSKWSFADIDLALGWNVVTSENGHAGFALHTVIPTGTRPWSTFLFEPVIGNGRHWELGLGFDGAGLIWEKDGNQQVEFLVDMRFTHLFKACQRRSFDFRHRSHCEKVDPVENPCGCCHLDCDYTPYTGFASRYMLLKEFDADGNYTGVLHPAINKTTLRCKVDNSIQFDGSFALGYHYEGFSFDIGYNAWIRSREKICNVECFTENKYGLKGVQNATNVTILGFRNGPTANATQSTATIFGNSLLTDTQANLVDDPSPVLLTMRDLDLESAASPCQFTHKIFWHFSHAWQDREHVPYLGFGGEVEFEGYRPKDVQPNKPAMAQWGLWLKGGFAF